MDDDVAVPDGVPTGERWEIDGTRTAEWAMARAAHAAERIRECEAQAAEWRQKIDDWLADVTCSERRDLAFFEGHLERYALDVREQTGRATLVLPSGQVRTRKAAAKIVVVDADALDDFAAGEPSITIRKVSKMLLNEHTEIVERKVGEMLVDDGTPEEAFVAPIVERVVVLRSTGEVVPGVEVEPEHVSATVAPSTDEIGPWTVLEAIGGVLPDGR